MFSARAGAGIASDDGDSGDCNFNDWDEDDDFKGADNHASHGEVHHSYWCFIAVEIITNVHNKSNTGGLHETYFRILVQ